MGLPVGKLICASNRNDVLTDFIRTGVYDRNRPFHNTISPSMDILVSSNLERLLFDLSEWDDQLVKKYMADLAAAGRYEVNAALRERIQSLFYAGSCGERETGTAIRSLHRDYGYLVDTHTAVAAKVLTGYRAETGDTAPSIFVSTASPFKFCDSVLDAIGVEPAGDSFQRIEQLEKAGGVSAPRPLTALRGRPERFRQAADRTDMERVVRDFLG